MLFLHILNLDGQQLTVAQTVLQRVAGLIGMYMNLDDLVVGDHHDAVADRLKIQTQLVGVVLDLGVAADNELGAVGKIDYLVKLGGGRTEEVVVHVLAHGVVLGLFDHNAVTDHAEHTLENGQDALAARVDNAGLFENREHLGGLLQRVGRGVADDLPQNSGVVLGIQRLKAGLIGHTGHGEDRTLGGLGDRVIGGLYTQTQRVDQIGAGSLCLALKAL